MDRVTQLQNQNNMGHRSHSIASISSLDVPSSVVELSVRCNNLADMDYLSKSDPMVVLYIAEFGKAEQFIEVGRTEVIWNNLNPTFAKRFKLEYRFEERQNLRFDVYDVDSTDANLSAHDFLGRCECSLGEVVSSGKLDKQLQQAPSGSKGTISVIAEEHSSADAQKDHFILQFAADIDKKGWFFSPTPHLEIHRQTDAHSTMVVAYKGEGDRTTTKPSWKPFEITLGRLCGGSGDRSRPLLLKVVDHNDTVLGEVTTTLNQLSEGVGPSTSFVLKNPKKQKNTGSLWLTKYSSEYVYSFMDYVQTGTQLNCTIAIDFTASNGPVQDPRSLHYVHPQHPNQYMLALQAVGDIIQDYDSDKLFPVLGFGARLPPNGQVSHEFFVNGDPSNPFCNGIGGVLDAYSRCVRAVQLYGPTNFAPSINHVARIAAQKRDGSEYFILLILTDGVITDMPQTTEALVNASTLPLSVIIVGVGDADFGAMNVLDGDEVRLSYNGRMAQRDIVQFVPFKDFLDSRVDFAVTRARLAKEVLAEIPDQFTSYMRANKIPPMRNPEEVRREQAARFGMGFELPNADAGDGGRGFAPSAPPL